MAVTWKKLAYEVDCVLKSLFDANTILAANTDNTPAAVIVDAQRIVGRITAGNIKGLTAAEVLALINVEAGADVTNATNVATAGAVMESDFAAKGNLLSASAASTPVILNVGANGKVLKALSTEVTGLVWGDDLSGVFENVADAVARQALTPALGKVCFQVDELAPYICTAIV